MRATISKEGRRIYWRTVLILAVILLGVTGTGFGILYKISLQDARKQLTELAQAEARIIESVAKFNAFYQSGSNDGAARSATLSQFKEGHRAFVGFGETGEIMLGQRVGDEIVFLLPARKLDFKTPSSINMSSDEAGPMKKALEGESGTVIDYDYSGHQVLAAYEWLPFLEMGLVTKIDFAEINEPFYQSAITTALLSLLAITIGAAMNRRVVTPLIERIISSANIIKERETAYRELVDTIPGTVYNADVDELLTMREISGSILEITGRQVAAFLDNEELAYADIVNEEDRQRLIFKKEGPFNTDYRIQRPDGEIRWVADHGLISRNQDGELSRKGILLDITSRKEAEKVLAELPRKLSRYISPQIYKSIFQGHQDAQVGNTRKKLTVFFSDIVNFTQKSESLDPDDLTFLVNSYLNRMAELAIKHGGTLDKFIGDGAVIFFGDPESRGVKVDANACVSMALDMMDAIHTLNEKARRNGINSPIEIRIGIATGYCTVGNFGSESRMDYTVMGKIVNLAARLESAASSQSILVSSDTMLLVEERFSNQPLEPIRVKGFEKPVPVFRITGLKAGRSA